jgi:hypothetical protein
MLTRATLRLPLSKSPSQVQWIAQAPHPIDGLHPYLLAARDLASGQQHLWLPLTAADAAKMGLPFVRPTTPPNTPTSSRFPLSADQLIRWAVEPGTKSYGIS